MLHRTLVTILLLLGPCDEPCPESRCEGCFVEEAEAVDTALRALGFADYEGFARAHADGSLYFYTPFRDTT